MGSLECIFDIRSHSPPHHTGLSTASRGDMVPPSIPCEATHEITHLESGGGGGGMLGFFVSSVGSSLGGGAGGGNCPCTLTESSTKRTCEKYIRQNSLSSSFFGTNL